MSDIVILDGVTEFGDYAFSGCTAVDYFVIPTTVQKIGKGVFEDCTALTNIELPEGLKVIDYGVFKGCTGLTSVTIPRSVTTIRAESFDGCTSLKDVYYGGHQSRFAMIDMDAKTYNTLVSAEFHCDYSRYIHTAYSRGDRSALITWSSVEDAEKYGLFVYYNNKPVKIAEFSPDEADEMGHFYYQFNNLTPGRKYKYKVLAMYDGKWDIDLSEVSLFRANSLSYPVVKAKKVSDRQFKLVWTEVDDVEDYVIAVKSGKRWKVLSASEYPATTPDLIPGGKFECDDESYTMSWLSPEMKIPAGTYYITVIPKINGEWDTTNYKKSMIKFTVR